MIWIFLIIQNWIFPLKNKKLRNDILFLLSRMTSKQTLHKKREKNLLGRRENPDLSPVSEPPGRVMCLYKFINSIWSEFDPNLCDFWPLQVIKMSSCTQRCSSQLLKLIKILYPSNRFACYLLQQFFPFSGLDHWRAFWASKGPQPWRVRCFRS